MKKGRKEKEGMDQQRRKRSRYDNVYGKKEEVMEQRNMYEGRK